MIIKNRMTQGGIDDNEQILSVRDAELMLDTVKHDTHRVQMFSLEEIWKNIEHRLINLNILIDPIVKKQLEADKGDESDDIDPKKFDFEEEA